MAMEDKKKKVLSEFELREQGRLSVEESLTVEDLPHGILSQLTSILLK